MAEYFTRIWKYVAYDEKLPLRVHLFRLLSVSIAFVCLFLVMPSNMLQDVSPFLNPVVAAYTMLVLLCYQLSRKGVHLFQTLYFLTLLLLNISWFLNGGSTGSISYFFLTTQIFPLILFNARARFAMLALLIVNFITLVFVEQNHPHLVAPFMSSNDRFLDLLTGFAVSVILTSLVFWVVVKGYDLKLQEHEAAELKLIESKDVLEEHIHSLKSAQQELLQYRTVVEGSRESIFILDRQIKFTLVNQAFLESLSLQRASVLGHSLSELIESEIFSEFKQRYDECVASSHYIRFAMTYKNLLKGIRNLDVILTPIMEDGAVEYVACVVRDITKQTTLEEQLRHSQRLESIGHLAGGIAHDFNNILSVVNGYAYLIEEELARHDADISMAREVLMAVEKASALTRGLLAFSRKQDMESCNYNFNLIVHDIEKFIGRLISEDIILNVQMSEQPLDVFVDVRQMEHVLINLATNARDAMPNGGRLDIVLQKTDMDLAFIESNGFGKQGGYALVTVSDTGFGMDAATCKRIFDPFFTTKEVGKGTGLGLAIAYGIIKQHQGFISVQSKINVGTVFSIYIPLASKDATQEFQTVEGHPFFRDDVTGSETILVVEDDEATREMMASMLTRHGYKVIPAVDGEMGIEVFRDKNAEIDLVISDVTMPRMNGFDMVKQIIAIRPNTRIIFTSGYTREALKGGGNIEKIDLIKKPLNPQSVLSKIRSCLNVQ